ncbi:hypothetical protein C7M61_002008 [Candidozyma pseudohaemuli]|uniref:candidapepsin n=1 Tax=Candidozyma pseudohaemuli TaxID=418784 RepID=A0A2P7YTV4_9ASCO|nr:hypothetical protein C7M61_002008 [[Candida] pseudohaemulonii]PSK39397.1 hypothetical protein C7M61_002008 [[Candida] pseudohaemulonii]
MLSFLTLLSLACSLTHALYIPNKGESQKADTKSSSSGVEATAVSLNFDITRRDHASSDFWPKMVEGIEKRHFKRDKEVTITNYQDVIYHIDVNVGNSKCTVSLDTGSSDLWVWGQSGSGEGGHYDSSLGKNTGQKFEISYLDQTSSNGDYYTDSFGFNGENLLKDFQFGVVSLSNDNGYGILGIADKNQEASLNSGGSEYDNLPWALKKQGVIELASYSLWINSGGDQSQGTILFGGKDSSKYQGDLTTYPVDKSANGLAITLNNMNIDGKSINVGAPVLLDSGTTGGILPTEVMNHFDEIFKPNKVTPSNGLVERYVDCQQPTDKFIEFDFGKNKIRASYQDVIMKFEENKCMLGFTDYQDRYILGDAFLRNAYVYYDLDNQEISLAQSQNSGGGHSPPSNNTSSGGSSPTSGGNAPTSGGNAPTSLPQTATSGGNGGASNAPTATSPGNSNPTDAAPSDWTYPGANPTSGGSFPAPTGGNAPGNSDPGNSGPGNSDPNNSGPGNSNPGNGDMPDFGGDFGGDFGLGGYASAGAHAHAQDGKHHIADTHAPVHKGTNHAKVGVV